jgi:hypothetical protein
LNPLARTGCTGAMLSSGIRTDRSIKKVDKSIGRCAVSRDVAARIVKTDTKASYTSALDRAKLAATREWQWRQGN